jgi:WD40 repeat protein
MQVFSCSWSLDGSKVVSCSKDKTVRVWDLNRGECIVTLIGHEGKVSYCQLREKCGCCIIKLNLNEFMNVQVNSCAWSPDGSKVVSCSEDITVRVWDVSRGECIVTLTGHGGKVSYCQL